MTVTTLTSGEPLGIATVLSFFWKFGVAPLIGFGIARAMIWTFNRLRPQDRGYYYVLQLGVALLTYGLAELAQASGMLAVFTVGYLTGNSSFVHKQGVLNFSAALSTIANIGMFVLLGLLVFPHEWSNVWPQGITLFLVLTFVARPVAVFLGTMGMGFGFKNRLFTSWAGLRGAVPIVLATYPAAAGMAIGRDVFNLVFFAVLLSILIQGSTLGHVAKWLKLSEPSRPKPLFSLEMQTMAQSDYELLVVDLPGPKDSLGPLIRDLVLPEGAVITLITRGDAVVLPNGGARLLGWDQVTLLAHASDEARIRDTFFEIFKHLKSD